MKIKIVALFGILLIIFLSGCVSLPPLEKVEYTGPKLEVSPDYEIRQIGGYGTIFMFTSSYDEKVLVNIYKEDGTLVGTLYQGPGGSFLMSLSVIASKYDFDMPPGNYLIVLYGEKGKAGFKLKIE